MKNWTDTLYGIAFGDAWGYRNEFKSYAELTLDNPHGPDAPEFMVISDDTQMTLYLANALAGTVGVCTDQEIRSAIIQQYVLWYEDEDNTRAPGNTCMTALAKIARGAEWYEATVKSSDGCGANMRVAAAAWLPDRLWAPVAAFQAAVTHGSPTAVAASLLTARVLRAAARGEVKAGELLEYAMAQAAPDAWMEWIGDSGSWLAGLVEPSQTLAFFDEGFQSLMMPLKSALHALDAFQEDPWADDPCNHGGAGWRAHEALATALLCADAIPGDAVEALRRATVTDGDSDSIAAIAGAVLGAVHANPWTGCTRWMVRLEDRYMDEIFEAASYTFN